MLTVLGTLESIIFLMLSLLHFHWVFGGKWGLDTALPTTEIGEKIMNPKKTSTALVGIVLFSFATYFFVKTNTSFSMSTLLSNYGGWAITVIFFLRAIGDFKYVGFFKKIKNTPFGKMDTKYFSPLCLFTAIIGLLIELNIQSI